MIKCQTLIAILQASVLVACNKSTQKILPLDGPQPISEELRTSVMEAILEYDKKDTVNAERMKFEVFDVRSDLSQYWPDGVEDYPESIGARFIVVGWEPKSEEEIINAPPRAFYVYVSPQNKVLNVSDEG